MIFTCTTQSSVALERKAWTCYLFHVWLHPESCSVTCALLQHCPTLQSIPQPQLLPCLPYYGIFSSMFSHFGHSFGCYDHSFAHFRHQAYPNTRDTCGMVIWGHFWPLWVPIWGGSGPKYGYFVGQIRPLWWAGSRVRIRPGKCSMCHITPQCIIWGAGLF